MRIILRITYALLLTIVAQSCFEDNSGFDINTIDGVVIDTTGNSELTVFQFDNLVVEPNVVYAGNEENLAFEWKINIAPTDTIFDILSNDKNLDAPIAYRPTDAIRNHELILTVTDTQTDIDYIMAWPLKVLNNIGQGIVVATTSDGMSTDLSHIMSEQVTSDFDGLDVKYNVYSSLNDGTINGVTKQLKYYSIYGQDAVLGITDNSIYKINTVDFTLGGTNGELFYVDRPVYSPQALGQVNQGSLFINNGNLTATYFGASQKFGVAFDSEFTVPGIIAGKTVQSPPVTIMFYDEEVDEFVYQPSITQFGDSNMYAMPNSNDGAFNPSTVDDKINLAASVGTDGNFRHLLKDENSGDVGLYIFDSGESVYPDVIPPSAIGYYDLSEAPEIQNAKFFVFVDNQRILYYTTDTKLYAVLYSTATATIQERYTLSEGERFTTLQIYQDADYPFGSDYLPLNNRALLASTYDENEGRVYLMPLINTGVGNVDVDNIQIWEGFDQVTALTSQF
ncbi:PKD-like family lipoprotein [Leeuwenhoekiella palythoae]|uniref:PKD family protein n=1 Tax=Leeuwenhoekiella palythoae TaxID=573501 RepID=A0A1M5WR85_9FLAO|nr:PKD-like family lipoprotein [Leeuwenhoekiella palythoae]RXG31472.1 PKD family protein [Leeuwenhoekiella palythoae]SHH89654.1 hypothetical protein SAMN04487999_1321 [Leeuwenhoekiella palythoae]